jgi:hypothetical protein
VKKRREERAIEKAQHEEEMVSTQCVVILDGLSIVSSLCEKFYLGVTFRSEFP